MILGFHYHVPALRKNNKIFMPGYLGVFIDSISGFYEELVLFLHSPKTEQLILMNYELKSVNIKLVSLGTYDSIPTRYLKTYIYMNIFKEQTRNVDLLLVRASTPLLPFINSACNIPLILLLVSKATEGIENLPQPPLKLFFIKLWANWYQEKENRIASNTLTLVNSQKLFNELEGNVNKLYLTKTTTLHKEDFFSRKDTCLETKIQLLYTGRITKNKGLLDIVESMSILIEEGYNLHLNLVGMVNSSDDILEKMELKSDELGLSNIFTYHGYKSVGDELLNYYRKSDIYVIASQSSAEGFPRTLWEAMASSLPIVATSVSSVPYYIKDAAALVEPNNPQQFADGIKKVINNGIFRRKIIYNGFSIAQENTLEKRAREMYEIILDYMEDE